MSATTECRIIEVHANAIKNALKDVSTAEVVQLIHDVARINGTFDQELLKRFQASPLYAALNEHQQKMVDNIINGGPRKPLKPYLVKVFNVIIEVNSRRFRRTGVVPLPSRTTGWTGLGDCSGMMLDVLAA
jgi:hypothetical protein